MAKGNNNVKPKRSHLYKPYDSANSSLVSRLTTRVSEILPQPSSWLSRWLTPAEQQQFEAESEEEGTVDESREPPPTKRLCLRQETNDVSTQLNHIRKIGTDPEISPILRSRSNQHDGVVAGPSGLHLRGVNFVASTPAVQPSEPPVKINGDEGSDGSESTSGCSSLVPQGERTLTAPFQANMAKASLETPKLSISPSSLGGRRFSLKPKNTSMSFSSSYMKSRPSFDAYAFNNPLNKSSPFNTSLNRTLDNSTTSPFYRGRTMYGGNSSCKESLSLSMTSPKVNAPRIVSVKPTATPIQSRDTISTSALKIFRAIEQFSTPVLDAKKIRLKSESERRKRKAPQPFEDLVIPTMPDLLRIKRKERKISDSSTTPSIPTISSAESTPKPYQLPPPVQPLSVRDDVPEPKLVIKSKNVEDLKMERVEKVNLPSIPLPITSLPSFNLTSLPSVPPIPKPAPIPSTIKPAIAAQLADMISHGANDTNKTPAYKFSQPLVENDAPSSIVSIKPTLKFSDPLDNEASTVESHAPKKQKSENSSIFSSSTPAAKNNIIPPTSVNFQMPSSVNHEVKKKPAKTSSVQPVQTMKTFPDNHAGSISDFFKANKNKSLENDGSTTKGFGERFKPATGSWTCDTCLVSNPVEKSKCCCCETPKEGTKQTSDSVPATLASTKVKVTWSCCKCSFQNDESSTTCVCGLKKGETPPLSGSLAEFSKAPPDSWECSVCLVRNKNSCSSCEACSNPKPGAAPTTPAPSLSSMFKKPEGSWECSVCMISNKQVDSACAACGTLKPGGAVTQPKPTFTFGIPPTTSTATSAKTAPGISSSFTPTTSTVPSTFTFGAAAAPGATTTSPFDVKKDQKLDTAVQFRADKFGFLKSSPSVDNNEQSAIKSDTSISSFGAGPQSKPTEDDSKDENKERPLKKRVSFGDPLCEEKMINDTFGQSSPALSFSFGSNPMKTEPSTTTFQISTAVTSKPSIFGNASGAPSSSTDAKTSSEPPFKFGGNSSGVSSSTDPTTTASAAPTTTETKAAPGFAVTKPLFQTSEKKTDALFSGVSTNKSVFPPSSSAEPKITFGFGIGTANKMEAADTSKEESPSGNLFNQKENKPLFGVPSSADPKAGFFGNAEVKSGSIGSFFNSESESKSIFGGAKTDGWNKSSFGVTSNAVFELKPATTVNNNPGSFNAPPVATTTVFGSQTASLNNTERKPLTFGSLQSTPNSNAPFMFKGTDSTPKPATGGFSFNAPTPAPTNAFGFTPDPPKFGAHQSNPVGLPAPQPPLIFGAPPTSHLFNHNPSPSPFTFGATQPEQQTQPTFAFPSAQPQAAAASFTFNVQNSISTPSPAQPPTFDPNIKPSFNFTGGATPAFAAPPSTSTDVKPERKIKKAFRRSQQR